VPIQSDIQYFCNQRCRPLQAPGKNAGVSHFRIGSIFQTLSLPPWFQCTNRPMGDCLSVCAYWCFIFQRSEDKPAAPPGAVPRAGGGRRRAAHRRVLRGLQGEPEGPAGHGRLGADPGPAAHEGRRRRRRSPCSPRSPARTPAGPPGLLTDQGEGPSLPTNLLISLFLFPLFLFWLCFFSSNIISFLSLTFTFTFRAFGRCFYPKRLTKSTCVEGDSNISLWYINIRREQVSSIHSCKVNRTSFIIARLPA